MGSSLTLKGLTRHFPGTERPALDGLDLDVRPGEVVCIVGPSGCGKSTTLRLIAGLDRPDRGQVSLDGRDISELSPQDRDVAMVFQGFALYPHMRVREIMDFPLKMRKMARSARRELVEQTAGLLGIEALLERLPGELSGGERQRVAMGRALVRRPKLFLFDEPLSNLDAALRGELRVELGALLGRLKTTALYVTHDQSEAMTLATRICVLQQGKLRQVGTPREIYQTPRSEFVASFFGAPPMSLMSAQRQGDTLRAGGLRLPLPRLRDRGELPAALTVGVRPEHVELVGSDAVSPEDAGGRGRVIAIEPLGATSYVTVDLDGTLLRSAVPGFEGPDLGDEVGVRCRPERIHHFSNDGSTLDTLGSDAGTRP